MVVPQQKMINHDVLFGALQEFNDVRALRGLTRGENLMTYASVNQ